MGLKIYFDFDISFSLQGGVDIGVKKSISIKWTPLLDHDVRFVFQQLSNLSNFSVFVLSNYYTVLCCYFSASEIKKNFKMINCFGIFYRQKFE